MGTGGATELAPLPTPLPEGTGDSEDTGCQWRKEDRSTFTALPADSARDPRSTGRNSASKSQALSLPPQPAPPCLRAAVSLPPPHLQPGVLLPLAWLGPELESPWLPRKMSS